MMSAVEPQARGELRSLLRELRSRLVSPRLGRAVSQEELAEWIGVSRNWYAALERGCPISPSISMLSRLAETLNATPDQRAMLFQLAIPALRGLF
ncbi:MAG: helix-turn-helix domain-containing protein [Candidatus Eremiobacteraeota bacterium]|nr:helix-turn-helix domain-containing protein [Candidatus Eremiobacteraeota bacterium]MBV8459332.1 helix-turn-helix domain-containing protein [Candidatus Eremiobacteraeota bacterium]